MKENVLEVLMYLFENYLDEEEEVQPDRDELKVELSEAGFEFHEVEKAFGWLDGLAESQGIPVEELADPRSMRIFSDTELSRLDTDCRGYLIFLEQAGILTATQRELCIDRLIALDSDELDIDQIKWVVLMVLFNQPGQEDAYARMEHLVFDDRPGIIH